MQTITQLDQIASFQGGVLSIGNFDGVHRGHQAMLRRLKTQSLKQGVPSIAMTFDPAPVALIAPHRVPPRLSSIARKAELIAKIGIDYLFVYPTNTNFLNQTADQFFQKIVIEQFQAAGMVEGENFFFGKDRQGDIQRLKQLTSKHHLLLQVIDAVSAAGGMISSTRIRKLISAGEIEEAVECLGHPYRITGTVIHGDQRGRGLGFPTANLAKIETLIPGEGVYAGTCLYEGNQYSAAINIGSNPTFSNRQKKFEVHLIGFNEDLYGQELSVDLIARCRDIKKFVNRSDLQEQLKVDIRLVQQITIEQ